ncbi:hypothetical protein MMC26_001731 [Xylographa opegraphella]|nr:hypothetical protein [Xylographa opegraphella]
MLEVPNAKRVRRQDLYSTSTSPRSSSPDQNVKALLKQQYESLHQAPTGEASSEPLAEPEASRGSALDQTDADEREDDGYEFRLFAQSTIGTLSSKAEPTKPSRIVLRSPSPEVGQPGFIQPRRPDSYYFTTKATVEEESRYESAAVSGEAVQAEQLRRWPGCELSWRVRTIKLSSTGSTKLSAATSDVPARKKQAGKKRRIVLRKRLVLEKAKKAALSMSKAEREAAEREKRTRRNREKKVKRKVKEKLKKTVSS